MGITFSTSSPSSGYGYHILRVQKTSPAYQAGLQPFFDFILSINGQDIGPDPHQMQRELGRNLGRPVELSVYSSKLRRRRPVTIVPHSDWGGQGRLGATVRLCALAGQPAMAWRVLDVAVGSPAELAGLRPRTDYIVGAWDSPMHSPEDLFDLVESRSGVPTRFYVYCCLADACRLVTVTPDPRWGGEGALGCGIGYGYLHQIPADHQPECAGHAGVGDALEPECQFADNVPPAPDVDQRMSATQSATNSTSHTLPGPTAATVNVV